MGLASPPADAVGRPLARQQASRQLHGAIGQLARLAGAGVPELRLWMLGLGLLAILVYGRVAATVPGQGTLHRLVVGDYGDQAAASQAARRLREDMGVPHAEVVATEEIKGS